MKLLRTLLLLYGLVVFESMADGLTEPLTEINVQLKWRHQFQFAGYYAAVEQGFYRQQGFKVNLLERKLGPTPVDKLILGHVDYAVGGVGALVYRAKGVPLVALTATFQHSPSILISRYPSLVELKNKKLMLTPGVMNAEITSMLRKAKLSLTDFETVPSNQSLEGFINGYHDAYNAYLANETYQLNSKNITYYPFYPRDYGIDFYGDILLTTERKIKSEIEQVKRFRGATIKGWEYAIKHADETVALIQEKYNSQNKTKQQLTFEANELIKLIYNDIVPVGYMNKQRWQTIAQVLKSSGDLDSGEVDIDGFLFSSYLKEGYLHVFHQHFKEILIASFLLIVSFLLLHKHRLKLIVKDRTKLLNKAREQAEHDARTDPLTGLANRRCFMEAITHDLSISRRNNLELSLIYIDIDWFKKINDTFGHAAGDEALKAIANILKRNVRASDTASRTGGEEFVIVCLEKDKTDAVCLAERVRKEIEGRKFSYKQQHFQLTISAGVASIMGDETVEQLLNKFDAALYKAKESGRNQVKYL